jgi:hypothetical protein
MSGDFKLRFVTLGFQDMYYLALFQFHLACSWLLVCLIILKEYVCRLVPILGDSLNVGLVCTVLVI